MGLSRTLGGRGVGVKVGAAVCVGVEVCVGVAVRVGVGVGVDDGVVVAVGMGVAVPLGVRVTVGYGVTVGPGGVARAVGSASPQPVTRVVTIRTAAIALNMFLFILRAYGPPDGHQIASKVIRQSPRLTAVAVYDIDLKVAVAVGLEGNLCAIG
jgi:hypothetical protein